MSRGKLMSVALTKDAVTARTKTVTRRLGWRDLEPGQRLQLVEKAMGLKPGQHPIKVADVEVVSVTFEPLHAITAAELVLEGLGQMTVAEFVPWFCSTHKGCTPETEVTRIEWRYIDADEPDHPAKFSAPILALLREILEPLPPLRILDPFAGIGRVHQLAELGHETVGVEIEPEWAAAHPRTLVGDAQELHSLFEPSSFDAIVTSPTYGNRMADQYDGRDGSKRYTYRLALGRALHPQNTARAQWGPAYWVMHWRAWCSVRDVLKPGGLMLLNVSNHYRKHELVECVGWHRARLLELGFTLEADHEIETRRMRNGANADARDEVEHVLVLRRPDLT